MSIFDEGFEEPDVNFPDKFLEDTVKEFSKATQDLAILSIIPFTSMERITISGLSNNFRFKCMLTSTHLKGYSFKVFDFGYDVSIYPVILDIEEEIGEEMKVEPDYEESYILSCENEDSFREVITSIFSTKKFKDTVGGLMKIARDRSENA